MFYEEETGLFLERKGFEFLLPDKGGSDGFMAQAQVQQTVFL